MAWQYISSAVSSAKNWWAGSIDARIFVNIPVTRDSRGYAFNNGWSVAIGWKKVVFGKPVIFTDYEKTALNNVARRIRHTFRIDNDAMRDMIRGIEPVLRFPEEPLIFNESDLGYLHGPYLHIYLHWNLGSDESQHYLISQIFDNELRHQQWPGESDYRRPYPIPPPPPPLNIRFIEPGTENTIAMVPIKHGDEMLNFRSFDPSGNELWEYPHGRYYRRKTFPHSRIPDRHPVGGRQLGEGNVVRYIATFEREPAVLGNGPAGGGGGGGGGVLGNSPAGGGGSVLRPTRRKSGTGPPIRGGRRRRTNRRR